MVGAAVTQESPFPLDPSPPRLPESMMILVSLGFLPSHWIRSFCQQGCVACAQRARPWLDAADTGREGHGRGRPASRRAGPSANLARLSEFVSRPEWWPPQMPTAERPGPQNVFPHTARRCPDHGDEPGLWGPRHPHEGPCKGEVGGSEKEAGEGEGQRGRAEARVRARRRSRHTGSHRL